VLFQGEVRDPRLPQVSATIDATVAHRPRPRRWGYYIAFHSYTFRIFMHNEFNPINNLDCKPFCDLPCRNRADVASMAWRFTR
jgi:hypothetical protein